MIPQHITPEIVRYSNIFPVTDFIEIERMITNRQWKIHFSMTDTENQFFNSLLAEDEIAWFSKRLNPYWKTYLDKPEYAGLKLNRAYINCHPAYHPGGWHTDASYGFSALYYPFSFTDWKDEGGTEFADLGTVNYENNSLLLFPQNHLHRGAQHTQVGLFRFSIAFKFLA
jgi:hypothetical protein